MKRILKPLSIIICWLLVLSSYSQEAVNVIKLDDAMNLALKNSPVLKNDELNFEINKLNNKLSWSIDPMELTYDYGQLNSSIDDYNFMISQDLGSPFAVAKQRKYYNAKVGLLSEIKGLTEGTIKEKVTSNFYEYLYLVEQVRILNDLYKFYKNLVNIADLKYQNGETNYLSKINAELKAEELHHNIEHLNAEIEVVVKSFNKWLFDEKIYIPEKLEMIKMQVPDDIEAQIKILEGNSTHLIIKEELNLAQQNIALQKSKLSPGFSVGYFNQQIDNVSGFQGFSLGVNIPVLYFNTRNSTKIAKLEYSQAQNKLANYDHELHKFLESKLILLKMYMDKIEHYEDHMVNRANSIIESAETLFKNGEISYLEYVNNLESALKLNLHYFELINNCNQTMIEIYYTIN